MLLFSTILARCKRHKKKATAGVVLLVLAGFGFARAMRPEQPEYVTAQAKRGDLRQTVEAVGTVISERDLELRFAVSGIIRQVFVREGDRVSAGQRLAQLKAQGLEAGIASQSAALQSAQAELRALEEGTRPEDIAIAEADLQNKRAALLSARQALLSAEENIRQSETQLEVLRQEAGVVLSGHVATSVSAINEQLTSAENALATVSDVISRTDVGDAFARNDPDILRMIDIRRQYASDAIASARRAAAAAGDYQDTAGALISAGTAAESAGAVIDSLFALISSLHETQYIDSTVREGIKTSIASNRSKIQDAAAALSSELASLQNAFAGFESKISAQSTAVISQQGVRDKAETDIMTYEAAVRSGDAQLRLKKAGARQTDIDAARARVRQSSANLARSRADYADTILTAPVSGAITHVNVRIGESTPSGAAITLLGESPYRVEMFVSEIDIPKVQLAQSGSIELDAFRDAVFQLRAGDIASAATDKEGVSKYRVRLDFVHPAGDVKIGMTGDAEIITGTRADVISIPSRAVLEPASGSGGRIVRILTDDGEVEDRAVITGMEGEGGEIEIVSGVRQGETVIVLIKQ
ncbi:efflux RND transporter periplasmic adaptor subunit [Candidatus Peregrinibacteria bacterium]|nr:efflux RND transporter periplasmic adaptor subunit [Candidatus Peregrinibacteria bacterium]